MSKVKKVFIKVIKWFGKVLVFDVFGLFIDILIIGFNIWGFDIVIRDGNDVGIVVVLLSIFVGVVGLGIFFVVVVIGLVVFGLIGVIVGVILGIVVILIELFVGLFYDKVVVEVYRVRLREFRNFRDVCVS